MTYGILYHPGHNRVYFETALKLAELEFSIVAQKISVTVENCRNQEIGGVWYFVFQTDGALKQEDIERISELSFLYALFRIEGDTEEKLCFLPLEKKAVSYLDESISTILKYTGKTNEIFTRMMLNIASANIDGDGEVKLLDPIAGKGTTLYEGLIKGYHVYGIEIGEKVTAEACNFLKRFLETARCKFELNTIRLSGPGKSYTATRNTFVLGRNKEEVRKKQTKTAEFIAGNSLYANQYFRKNFFDMIVGDLPYGIQHGNVTNEKQTSLTRSPMELLSACLPVWSEVLRPGGVIVLAWNSNVFSREKMVHLVQEKGLQVLNDGPYTRFEHRVDQSIKRDIIVALKK